jgi:hypothetical protein
MEIFIDGGLFELSIAIATAYLINFIFLRKYLLIIFSVATITAPVIILFIPKGELFYFISAFSILNSIFLVLLLWKQRTQSPREPLVNIEKYRNKIVNGAKRWAKKY